ncbi:MAG TPA: hypothetical protein VFQ39_11460 [Longimicrobium sp.]|nr:hypothetical protein [Longimicrobium sp.]
MEEQTRGGVHAHSEAGYGGGYAGGGAYGGGGASYTGPVRTVLTDVDIPFGQLVTLILKVMLASIPAYIILFIIFMIIGGIFGGIFAGLMGGMH